MADEPENKKEEKEERPKWVDEILNALKGRPEEQNPEQTVKVPVPPVPEEPEEPEEVEEPEDEPEPEPKKKRSFLDWFM